MQCTFCKFSGDGFLPNGLNYSVLFTRDVVGGGYRPHARCPECGSLDRERLIHLYLETQRVFDRAGSVLHVAPEKRLRAVFQQAKRITYVSADIRPLPVTARMDVTKIPFRPDSFDIILCNHVLEHVENDYQALAELHRVLKPSGFAILQVPVSRNSASTFEDPAVTSEQDRAVTFGQKDHVRIYGLDYQSRLEAAQFTVETFDVAARFGPDAVARYSLIPGELVHIVRRRS
jgi:SAM-dependent methyltransferase